MRILIAITLVVGSVVAPAVRAQTPPDAPPPPSYQLTDFGVMPRPAFRQVLLALPAVQEELKLTDSQKKEVETTVNQHLMKMQNARHELTSRRKLMEFREALMKELEAALRENLEPRQRKRLDQIQLQAQGPLAFNGAGSAQMALVDPELAKRLKLTDDQIRRTQTIAEEGTREIEKAAAVPILIDSKASAPTRESVRRFVESPEFKTAKRATREAARNAWTNVVRRIEDVLTDPQRTAYHEMVGAPFDLSKLRSEEDATAEDVEIVVSSLNVGGDDGNSGGGQRADPDFDTKVARPAYTSKHPRVLFDEAHNNFHTAGGRYKPFAEVVANDGYKITPSKDKFTAERLSTGDVLIIANALGAAGMGRPGASDSAFTKAEIDAVHDWVQAGGSLLLITDHAPFGSAAESLAKRLGVDMSKGFTSDPENSEGGETSLVFTRKNNLLGDHPITRGRDDSERINRVQTFTGQSLKGPVESVAILKLADTAVDEGADEKPKSAAGRAQGVAFTFGKGRVVVLGEAAEMSAQLIGNERFGMNVKGLDNRQLALNIMHWLSGLLEPRGDAK
ncbi:MAG: hypothetical protein P4L85_02850 [Paludisphaera borealis]|uniref:hypothetical protein n=1 Tax=Paludisphaera borealis TaxID=1387353 RepID=UPI00284A6F9A|nr:hypothetical protein [Paludisphaera borealis]MDR3618261.1 hypothetical protein [Paludisphaera borealis]